jgi:hypothetical protein
VVGDDVLSKVMPVMTAGKGIRQLEGRHRNWQNCGFSKFGKLPRAELGYNEARSDTCKRITPASHFPRTSCSSQMMSLL